MGRVLGWIGCLFFVGLVVNFALGFGSKWTWGRYYMPSALVAEDGRHHPDGSDVEYVTLMIAQSGHEQEIYLGGVLVLLALVALLVKELRQAYRLQLEIRQMELRYLLGRDETAPGAGNRAW